MAAEDVIPEKGQPELNVEAVSSPYLGGVVNPLAEQQTPIEMPKLPVSPKFNLPAQKIPASTGQYSGGIQTQTDYLKAAQNHIHSPDSYARNPLKYGSTYSYDADYTGQNFARYYSAPKVFKQVGFSPWRDNESLYNNKMSWFDSYTRAVGQGTKLAGLSFSSMLPWNAWDGSATDKNSAASMRAHAIGADNREQGGVGKFFNNLTLDAGYTVGILAEFGAEEIALWAGSTALAPFTGGSSWMAASAEAVNNFRKATSLAKNIRQTGRVIAETGKVEKELNAISKVTGGLRNWYKEVKAGGVGGALEKIGDLATPSTFAWAKDSYQAAKTAEKGDKIFNIARVSQGFGSFYRDTREMAAVLSESKMEGGMVEAEMRDTLVDKFYKDNGRMPDANDYAKIYQHAHNAGKETFMWNLPALWISNKIVFDKAFKGVKAFRAFRENLMVGTSKLTSRVAKGKYVYGAVKATTAETLKSLGTKAAWAPKNVFRNVLHTVGKYGAANLTEGLQETYQDALSNAVKDYYEASYEHPARTGMHEAWGAFADRLTEQATTSQGLQTFASGFLMGGLIQGPQQLAFQYIPRKIYQFTKPEEFKNYTAAQAQRTNNVVTAMNGVNTDLTKTFSPIMDNTIDVSILNEHSIEAASKGDTKSYLDWARDAASGHLYTIINSGHTSILRDQLTDMKDLTGEELEQGLGKVDKADLAQGEDAKSYLTKKLDKMIGLLNYIENRHQEVEQRMGAAPILENDKISSEAAWAVMKKMAVMGLSTFDDIGQRMTSIQNNASKDKTIGKAPATDFGLLFDRKTRTTLIGGLKEQIKGSLLEGSTVPKSEIKELEDRLEVLNNFELGLGTLNGAIALQNKAKTDEEKKTADAAYDEAHGVLKERYFNYLKHIAKVNDDFVFNDKAESSFVDLVDFYKLKGDHDIMANAINIMNDPNYIKINHEITTNHFKTVRREQKAIFIKSYKNKIHAEDLNALMNEIFENEHAYFSPETIEKIKSGQPLGNILLIDATTDTPIDPKSDNYKNVMGLIATYQKLHPVAQPTPQQTATSKTAVAGTTTGTTTTSTTNKVNFTKNTPLTEMFAASPKLVQDLYNLFKVYQEDRLNVGNITQDEYDEIINETKDVNKAINHPAFINFIKNATPKVITTLEKFNKDPNRPNVIPVANTVNMNTVAANVASNQTTPSLDDEEKEKRTDAIEADIKDTLSSKKLILTDDETQYVDENGELYDRVTSLKEKEEGADIPIESTHRGTLIDAITRDFLPEDSTINSWEQMKDIGNESLEEGMSSELAKLPDDIVRKLGAMLNTTGGFKEMKDMADAISYVYYREGKSNPELVKAVDELLVQQRNTGVIKIMPSFTDEFYQELFQALTKVKNLVKSGNFKVVTDIPILWGTIAGKKVAGTIDLLLIDKDNGSIWIVDLKTSTLNRREDYSKKTGGLYKEGDRVQLNAYAKLFDERMTGHKTQWGNDTKISNIAIFPLQTRKKPGTLVYDSIELLPDLTKKKLINPENFKGRLIYATPGTGKSQLISQLQGVKATDVDNLIVDEINKLFPTFTRKKDESIQDFIGRFSHEVSGGKSKVNEEVLKTIAKLKDEGHALFTGTLAFIDNADIVFTGDTTDTSKRFPSGGKREFLDKEKSAVAKRAKDHPNAPQAIKLGKEYLSDVISEFTGKHFTIKVPLEDIEQILAQRQPKTEPQEGIPLGTAASEALVKKGIKLGFTAEQVDLMSQEERDLVRKANAKEDVQDLIDKYTTKSIYTVDQLTEFYNKVNTIEQLEEMHAIVLSGVEREAATMLKNGVTPELIEQLYTNKLNELNSIVTYEQLVKDKAYKMKDGKIVELVALKENDTIGRAADFQEIGNLGAPYITLMEDEIPSQIMANVPLEPGATSETKDESINNAKNASGKDAADAWAEVEDENLTPEELAKKEQEAIEEYKRECNKKNNPNNNPPA